ncbi:Indigoidine synthase A like protein domain protein, partial [mine drainage metagenome]
RRRFSAPCWPWVPILGECSSANPIDPAQQLDPAWHAELLAEALGQLDAQGIHGKAVTPFLLNHLERATRGESVRANRALVLGNARLAAQVARALADG